jgi:hypothetical protein
MSRAQQINKCDILGEGQEQRSSNMPSHTLHVVQAFEQRDGGIVPVEPKACPSAASARALAARLAQTHVGVIAWSRTGDPDLGDWGPPVVLVRTGVIPDEFEVGGGVE